jgi:hypothetical protein
MSTLNKPLPFSRRIGDFILVEVAAISASSIVILLGYIAVSFLDLVEWPTSPNTGPLSIAQLPFAKARGADGD